MRTANSAGTNAEEAAHAKAAAIRDATTKAAEPAVTLFLCGDVMTGRGIDQILAHPSPPHLYEPVVSDAREYVALAERAHGPLARPVDAAYVWGDALEELDHRRPDLRIINLETSVTSSEDAEPKGINYRMHPGNAGVLSAARIDCAVLANNHVLDWGAAGLAETLSTLADWGIATAGAGRSRDAAQRPATLPLRSGGRVLVLGVGGPDCGIPSSWAAGPDTRGVFRIDDYSDEAVDGIAHLIATARRERDIVITSIHWGENWGYDVPDAHRRFAHALVDRARVDIVHGHSSHHPRGIELRHGRVVLYGSGDFLNDYEGIEDHSGFRSDLTFMYLATLEDRTGALRRLEMVPLLMRNFRLRRPPREDRDWLFAVMTRECRRLGTEVEAGDDVLIIRGDP